MIPRARLKYLRSLRLRKNRLREGLLLAEGLNVVEEAVASGHAEELLLGEQAEGLPRVRELLARGLPAHRLGAADVRQLAETRTPSGIFALVRDPCRPLAGARLPATALVLVAAGVADPGNLGTLIRTAAALGAAAVVATAGTVEPMNPKVVRATAGALFRIPVLNGEAADLVGMGFSLRVADAGGEPVSSWRTRPARLALAVGNEPRGIDAGVRALAAGAVGIPLEAGVESLNVAVAAGILLHAIRVLPVVPA
ncbi:MAG TPA: RNA methyltransferase [Planctomycetota bacterium]|nr:RNA methyltransferase [Planctomycetota bacterium]